MGDFEGLEKRLGYRFHETSLLHQALHHSSLSKVKGASPFERLEFLGDRVLNLVIANWLYALYPEDTEGMLAVRHSALVRRSSLVAIGGALQLVDALRYDQQKGPARLQEKIIADSCEALLGALFLDAGFGVVEERIRAWWAPLLQAHAVEPPFNPKSLLQEWAQAHLQKAPLYVLRSRSGPDHQPSFVVEVVLEGYPTVQASGASKKDAEMAAAQKFWDDVSGKKEP